MLCVFALCFRRAPNYPRSEGEYFQLNSPVAQGCPGLPLFPAVQAGAQCWEAGLRGRVALVAWVGGPESRVS